MIEEGGGGGGQGCDLELVLCSWGALYETTRLCLFLVSLMKSEENLFYSKKKDPHVGDLKLKSMANFNMLITFNYDRPDVAARHAHILP